MKIISDADNWYKGNLHMHTTDSDGALDVEEAVARYRDAGYDFIAVTDHRRVNPGWEEEDFLVLPGVEYDTGGSRGRPVYHILGIGMARPVHLSYYRDRMRGTLAPDPQEIIDEIRAAGGIAILAHPAWSVMTPEEMFHLHGFAGAEIYNTVSGLPWNPDRADSSVYFDIWAKNGKLVPAFAADDAHEYNGDDCRSYIMVNAPALTGRAILDSIMDGDFYASQGPEFQSISCDDGIVRVRFSEDVRRVVFITNAPWGPFRVRDVAEGSPCEEIYECSDSDRWCRIMLVNHKGEKAWSSPFETE